MDPRGVTDVYIDNIMGLCVDLPSSNNALRLEKAILLVIHAASRPVHESEPIPRDKIAAITKLLAEVGLEEIKMILGWHFDFRRMTVALPDNTHTAWMSDVVRMVKKRETSASELDTTIGRLGNMGLIMCQIYHF